MFFFECGALLCIGYITTNMYRGNIRGRTRQNQSRLVCAGSVFCQRTVENFAKGERLTVIPPPRVFVREDWGTEEVLFAGAGLETCRLISPTDKIGKTIHVPAPISLSKPHQTPVPESGLADPY